MSVDWEYLYRCDEGRITKLEADLAEESRQADEAVDSVVAKVKWYHAELEERDITIKALRHCLAWKPRTQKAERSET